MLAGANMKHLYYYAGGANNGGKVETWVGVADAAITGLSHREDVLVGSKTETDWVTNSNEILPIVTMGVTGRGIPVRMLLSVQSNAADAQQRPFEQYTPGFVVDEEDDLIPNCQFIDDTAARMLVTPDEYMARNGKTLETLMSKLSYFQANDFYGAFSKGFMSSFWERTDDLELEVMGELMHLGMSMRLKIPVRNCHKSALQGVVGREVFDKSDPPVKIDDVFTGHFIMKDPAGVGDGSEEESDEESQVFTELAEGELGDWGKEADGDFTVYAMNAAVNPFFLYLEDAVVELPIEGTRQGLFFCVPELGNDITPGEWSRGNASRQQRDISFEDFISGLKWLVDNTHADMASNWSTVGRFNLPLWKDIRKGELVDLFSYDSQTEVDAMAACFVLGETNNESIQNGNAVTGGYLNNGRFYGNGFIDKSEIDQAVRELSDLGDRNFTVGRDWDKGLQRVGTGTTSVYHATKDDGKEVHVDIVVHPVVIAHWSLVPTSWHDGAKLWTLSADMDHANSAFDDSTTGITTPAELEQFAVGSNAGAFETCANISHVSKQPDTGMTNWQTLSSDLTVSLSLAPSVVEGWDLQGRLMVRTTGTSPDYAAAMTTTPFLTESWGQPIVTLPTQAWMTFFSRIHTAIILAKDITPYQSEIGAIELTSVNLVADLLHHTGEPALQQLADSIFTLGFCGRTGGWHFEAYANQHTMRRLHDPLVHTRPSGRTPASPDYVAIHVPSTLNTDMIPTAFATANTIAYNLGILGYRWLRDTATSRGIDLNGVRTIYTSHIAKDGRVHRLSITDDTTGYNYFTMAPEARAGITANQFSCQPGALPSLRLFTHLDGAAAAGANNSLCSLYGMQTPAVAAGSNVVGLLGYAADVPPALLVVLNAVHRDNDGVVTVAFGARPGDASAVADQDFWRLVVENNRGNRNLYFGESAPKLLLIDQDVFDFSTAVKSAIMAWTERKMILGPIEHAVVYDQKGETAYEVVDFTEIVSSGEAARKPKTSETLELKPVTDPDAKPANSSQGKSPPKSQKAAAEKGEVGDKKAELSVVSDDDDDNS
jgi:hypothetical protein